MTKLVGILTTFLESAQMAKKNEDLKLLEKGLEKDMQKVFRKQKKIYLDELKKYKKYFAESIDDTRHEKIFDIIAMNTGELMQGNITKAHKSALNAGAESFISTLGLDIAFDLKNPRATAFLEEQGASMVTAINETSRSQIKTVVTKGIEGGWSYDRTAEAISGRFEEFAVGMPQKHIRSRAHLVAVTENAKAYEHGNYIAGQQVEDMGILLEKSWLTVGDSRVSEGCATNEAEGWIDFEASFNSGHQYPPRFPACRCTLLRRRKEE